MQAVPLLLQLLTIAAMGMLLVVSFHSLPVNTKATAVKNNVWEQLPSMTMTQSLSLALATAAVSAVLAEVCQSLCWCPLIPEQSVALSQSSQYRLSIS